MKRSYEALQNRVSAIQAKRASKTPDTEDPTEEGVVTPPNHPDGDSAAKKHLPEGTANTKGDANLPAGAHLDPAGTGEQLTSAEDGNKKEEAATKPNDPLSKIAKIVDRVKTLRDGKSASEEGDAPNKEAAPAAEVDESSKEAGDGLTLSTDARMKLANVLASTEEGRAEAVRMLQKVAGQEAAADLIKAAHEEYASYANQVAEQEAYFQKAASDYQALEEHFAELTKNASEEDLQKINKLSKVHRAAIDTLEYDFEKAAYFKAAMDAAAMEEAMAGGAAPEDAMIPEGGEEPLSVEAILDILEQLVASGQMSEEEATEIAAELMGEDAPAEAMPEELKMASEILSEIETEETK